MYNKRATRRDDRCVPASKKLNLGSSSIWFLVIAVQAWFLLAVFDS